MKGVTTKEICIYNKIDYRQRLRAKNHHHHLVPGHAGTEVEEKKYHWKTVAAFSVLLKNKLWTKPDRGQSLFK